MKDVLAFVQARMGSSRLPGKSLMELWRGMSVLEVLLERLAQCSIVNGVVVATSIAPADQSIEDLCRKRKIPCFRGDEKDVLGRFAAAAQEHPANWYVRVCADNPLTDPDEVDALAAACLDKPEKQGYLYNNRPGSGLADGLGAEIVSAEVLNKLAREAKAPEEREHVTVRAFQNRQEYKGGRLLRAGEPDPPEIRLDVDYPQDLEFLRRLCGTLDQRCGPLWTGREIVAKVLAEPSLLRLRAPR